MLLRRDLFQALTEVSVFPTDDVNVWENQLIG